MQTVIITLTPTPIISIPEAPLRRFISSPVLCYYNIQVRKFWLMKNPNGYAVRVIVFLK